MDKKPIKPFSLEYAEAKNKIIKAINEATQIHGVPFYLLEDMLTVISQQVQSNANKEREKAKNDYEEKLKEYEEIEG